MTLELIKAVNTNMSTGSLTVNINNKGIFAFSKAATEQLKLIKGTKINFHYDKNRPHDWYLEICEDGELTIRTSVSVTNAITNSASIANAIKKNTNNIGNYTIRARIGAERVPNVGSRIIYPLLIAKK